MKEFIGVFRYEYRMSIRRWSLWLSFGLLMLLHMTSVLMPPDLAVAVPKGNEVFQFAGTMGFMFNIFMPVVGGILAADRLVRDQKIGVDELLRSTALRRITYLAGKYFATVCSITTPVLIINLLMGASRFAMGAPVTIFPAMLVSFLAVNLPAYLFIVAFALACPLVIPVRVFQVLYTGYWFWGNLLSPTALPTLNGTYLTANGLFMVYGFFGGVFGFGGPVMQRIPTQVDAIINLAVLAIVAGLALFAADRYLVWREANR